jgi:hypothetical protein
MNGSALSNRWKIAAILVILALITLSTYMSDVLPQPWGAIVSVAFGGLIVYIAMRVQPLRDGQSTTVPRFRIHWRELLKAAGCVIGIFVWILAALPFISDTIGGMIILLAPCLVLGTAALYFFSRSY